MSVSQRILIVEDDFLNRVLLCTVLENSGYLVKVVTDGAQVLKKAREFVPNLITALQEHMRVFSETYSNVGWSKGPIH